MSTDCSYIRWWIINNNYNIIITSYRCLSCRHDECSIIHLSSPLLKRNPIGFRFATRLTCKRLFYVFTFFRSHNTTVVIIIIRVTKTIPLNSSCRSPHARYTVKLRGGNLDQSTVMHANGGGWVKGIKYIMYRVSRNSLRGRFPPPSRAQ